MIAAIDGSYMLHRVKFIAKKENQANWRFLTFLFMNSLVKTCTEIGSKGLYVLWDCEKGSSYRLALFPEYKSERHKKVDEEDRKLFQEAKSFLRENLPKVGCVSVQLEGVEADDLAFAITQRREEGVLVSDDGDWFLNMNQYWKVYKPNKKKFIDYEELKNLVDEPHRPQEKYLLMKALMGDKSDSIPGIRGIGPVNAKRIADDIFDKTKGPDSKGRKTFKEHHSTVIMGLKLCSTSYVYKKHPETVDLAFDEAERETNKKCSIIEWATFCGEIESDSLGRSWQQWKRSIGA